MFIQFPPDGVVIALDPAKRCGFCFGRPRDKVPTLDTILLAREHDTAVEIFGRAAAWWGRMLAQLSPDLVAIEAPIAPAEMWGRTQYQTTIIAHGLFAVLTALAQAQKIPVLEVGVATWRKYFLGRGKLPGDQAKASAVRLCRQLGWTAVDHNAAEAAGIWCWACAQVEPARVRRIEPLFVTGRPE